MFVGKAIACLSTAPFRCSTLELAPGFTYKHKTRPGKLGRDKRSSLLQKFVNYGHKKFCSIGSWYSKNLNG